jgi:hypothetical protein
MCSGNGDSTVKIFWIRLALGFVPGLLASPQVAHSVSAQHVENTSEICAQGTARVERATGIPSGLLGALSLAETGRWNPDRQESFAWPWTVMAEGRGRYFESKDEAVAEVYALLDLGLTNIDVGCMQINLHYHGGAFADIEQAMDPAANIAYAGRYLSNLYKAAKSWPTAAGYYHSMTPDRGNAYRERVMALWDGMEKTPERMVRANSRRSKAKPFRTRALPRAPLVSIDMARTAELNAQFRLSRQIEAKVDFATQRRQDLAFWRESRAAGQAKNHLSLMRRVKADSDRRRARTGSAPDLNRTARFAAKRHDQLRRWRLSAKKSADAS